MYQLRDYQQTAADRAVNYFQDPEQKDNVIEVLPTGSGKSLVIAEVVTQLDEPVLVFQPTKEILEQNYQKLCDFGFLQCSIFSASFNSKAISKVTFATIGSVVNRPEMFQHFKYFIIDECHYVNAKGGMYKKFIEAIGDIKILGLTATPYRLATNSYGSELRFLTRTWPKIFKRMIYYVQIQTLLQRGYLAKMKYYSIAGFDSTQLQINTTGAEFTDKSVAVYMHKSQFAKRVANYAQRMIDKGAKNILIFVQFVKQAEEVQSILGDVCESITGTMTKNERTGIITRFKSGITQVVVNVGVLTVGFDYPELTNVIVARPTMSLALWSQMGGRASRPHPDKDHSNILDMCGNLERFGVMGDLWIAEPKPGMYHIESKGKQLTNVILNPRNLVRCSMKLRVH